MRRLVALALMLVACKTEDDETRKVLEARCESFCSNLSMCGLLPSPLGIDEGNCRARCTLTDEDVTDDLILELPPPRTERGTMQASNEVGLAGWCEGSPPTCSELAEHVRTVLGDPLAAGEGSVTVAVVASFEEDGECSLQPEGGAATAHGPCRLDLPCPGRTRQEGLEAALGCVDGGCFYAVPRGLNVESSPTFSGALGVASGRIRIDSLGPSSWQEIDPLQLSRDFAEALPGPVQAVVELRGEYPPSEPSPDPAMLPQLDAPPGGLVGGYCFVFRSATTLVQSGEAAFVKVPVPPTAAHVVARAWAQADAVAKGAGATLYTCEDSVDACRNGLDDDGDDLEDCVDSDCSDWCNVAEQDPTTCADGIDNDGDDHVDCADPGCVSGCEATPAECRDGRDDDADGRVDCADPGCAAACARRPCPEGETCTTYLGEAELDCESCATSTCAWQCALEPDVLCNNLVDDDGDGLTDCADPDCGGPGAIAAMCTEDTAVACANGRDEDGDARVDCNDEDCSGWCTENGLPQCADERDNDGDALVDCDDEDCEIHCSR